ncbi:MAG: SH3 domain-containing protein, partial [Chloroflexota bacterium]|nr:SH3 domain-containing protein [Chloroflexota bacterium]
PGVELIGEPRGGGSEDRRWSAVVTTSRLRLFAGPSTGDAVLAVLRAGSRAEALPEDRNGEFVRLRYGDREGWARAAYLTAPSAAVPERPARAPGVELVGELRGGGFKDRQWLVQRDGRFVQLTELLYRVAEGADGTRTPAEIAAGVTAATDWLVSADHVRYLVATKLIPMGLVAAADGAVVARPRGHSPFGLTARRQVIGPRVVEPVAGALQVFFAPPVLVPVLIAAAIAHAWVYLTHDVTASFHDLIARPGLLLPVGAVIFASGTFHEFGHAAALRYGGGKVRGMGVGIILVDPAFYTDVTDSYRLGRWARVRTDVGGLYFDLVFALGAATLAYLVPGQREFWLLVVLLVNLDMLDDTLPLMRLDGYWILADLTGIPDLYSRMGLLLRGLPIPGRKRARTRGALSDLKPWVKAVFVAYTAVTIPVLGVLFYVTFKTVPVVLEATRDSLLRQATVFSAAQGTGDYPSMATAATQMLLLALPVLGIGILLYSLVWRPIRALWTWSKPTPTRRLVGALGAAAIVGLAAILWWPHLPFVLPVLGIGILLYGLVRWSVGALRTRRTRAMAS